MPKITYLKVKIKSLAAEGSIIRKEERKAKGHYKWLKEHQQVWNDAQQFFFSLQGHRKFNVRDEARAALLAYGFLRGRAYKRIENKYHELPDLIRVAEIVNKFNDGQVTFKTDMEKSRLLETNFKLWDWLKEKRPGISIAAE